MQMLLLSNLNQQLNQKSTAKVFSDDDLVGIQKRQIQAGSPGPKTFQDILDKKNENRMAKM